LRTCGTQARFFLKGFAAALLTLSIPVLKIGAISLISKILLYPGSRQEEQCASNTKKT
jgi:hypothetical protein